jgi:hypothetical protein
MPDYRTLLYWSPKFRPMQSEKQIVFASLTCRKICACRAGTFKQGLPGAYKCFFTVKSRSPRINSGQLFFYEMGSVENQ